MFCYSKETPGITLCFSPPYKQSIMDEYNLASDHFDDIGQVVQLKKFVDKASYLLNTDFYLSMFWSKENLDIGTNMVRNHMVNVTKAYSLSRGLCYLISTNFEEKDKLILSLEKSDSMENLKVFLTFTSKNHSILSLDQNNLDVLNPFEMEIDFSARATTIALKESKRELITNCNFDGFYHLCLAEEIVQKLNETQCPTKCTSVFLNTLNDLPLCDTKDSENCIHNDWQIDTQKSCQIECKITEFTGKIRSNGKSQDNSTNIHILKPKMRIVTKEYLIYNEVGMIGTIGGSLGLFLGFSFYGAISDLLEFIKRAKRAE